MHSTKGRVDIEGVWLVHGCPLFYGQARLRDGEVDTKRKCWSLRQINGTLVINGDQAKLNASLHAGKGTATLTGHTRWPGGVLSGVLALRGKEVELAFAGYGNGRVDSDLQLQFDAEQARLDGDIIVPWPELISKSAG